MPDTGASGGVGFINPRTAQRILDADQSAPWELPRPKPIRGYDGRLGPPVTHGVITHMRVGNHLETTCLLYITPLANHSIILGKAWMKQHGVILDLLTETLYFRPGHCSHVGAPEHPRAVPKIGASDKPPKLKEAIGCTELRRILPREELANCLLSGATRQAAEPMDGLEKEPKEEPKKRVNHRAGRKVQYERQSFRLKDKLEGRIELKELAPGERQRIDRAKTTNERSIRCTLPRYLEVDENDPESMGELQYYEEWKYADEVPESPIQIALIGSAPFHRLAAQPGAQLLQVSIKEILYGDSPAYSQRDPDIEPPPEEEIKRLLPKEFHAYIDVFSKKEADTLPPHRDCDHHITLTGDLPSRHTPLYRMSDEERAACKRFIEENLSKGFIEASQSPFASPVLFVRKPGGRGLRFCVDYRRLNAVTRRDRYPLPLIDECLAQLTGAKFITKLDIRNAFNRIRMKTPEDEELTTFLTSFGAFKSKVLPFGLTNGPATFQAYINNVLQDYLNRFVMAYIDDILIYSRTRDEHTRHVRQVLESLRRAGLQADISKCEFYTQKTKFLGLVISTTGIEMDSSKVSTILEWNTPRNVHDVQAFNGFCNFYRRFIKDYSKIVVPLMKLTRKDEPYFWSTKCEEAFQTLKQRVTDAPVLAHFDRTKTCFVESDSSDHVTSGVLSQYGPDGFLHPVAYFSKKMVPAECNYEIYDKELLAIIRCFEEWRPELQGTGLPIQVLTDHKALEYFMSTKKLTRRQARWAEFLSEYNFQVTYRTGKSNTKADALTRRPGDAPESDQDDRQRHMLQTILTPERIHPDASEDLGLYAVELADMEEAEAAEDEADSRMPIAELIQRAQQEDDLVKDIIAKKNAGERRASAVSLSHCSIDKQGQLRFRDKIWVPENRSCRLKLIREAHDSPACGHEGPGRTLVVIQREYYWPGMDQLIKQYCRNCRECRTAKASREAYNGVLNPLPVPHRPWTDISMDFVVGLPKSGNRGYNAILVVMCRLSKQRHFIPCVADERGTSAEATARMLVDYVWKLHGLPDTMVSDRGPQFVAEVWKHLCRILRINARLSTAFHPETDGQSEIANSEMERYLRTYVNYMQDDWSEWLPIAEFSANNSPSSTTKLSPFFANYGYHPRMSFDPAPKAPATRYAYQEAHRRDAADIAARMERIWQFCADHMALAQAEMERAANKRRTPAPDYKPGDMVFISTKNIKTERPSKKLDYKNIGPYPIVRKVGQTSYEVDLPPSVSIHPVFHSSLLRLDANDPLPY